MTRPETIERPAAPESAAELRGFGPTLDAFLLVARARTALNRPVIAGLLAVSDWLERIGEPVSRRRTTIRVHGLLLIAHWLGTPDAPDALARSLVIREGISGRRRSRDKAVLAHVTNIITEARGTVASPHQLALLDRLNRKLAKERRPEERAKIVNERADLLDQIERRRVREQDHRRRLELASLEQMRGGEVVIEETTVDVPVLRDGAPVWRRGKIETRQEVVTKVKVTSRDGLETLATAHLHSDGKQRMHDDGKTPMAPIFTTIQLAALDRYRGLFLEHREVSLRAVDATEAGGDRTPFNVQRSMTLERLVDVALREKRDDEKGRSFARAEAYVSRIAGHEALTVLRAVAGEGHTIRSIAPGRRKAIRYTKALLAAADVLADRFGLT